MAWVGGQRFGPDGPDPDARAKTRRRDDDRQEIGLLPDRFDEEALVAREDGRERNAREAATAAEIEDRRIPKVGEGVHRGQAVHDVPDSDRRGIVDRRQVDRRVPGEEEPNVVVDDAPAVGRDRQAESRQPVIEGMVIRLGERWKAVDARRERPPLAVQALLLRSCLRGPPGLRSRRRRSFTPFRASVFRGSSGSRPGFPVPLASRVTRVVFRCGCRTLGGSAAYVNRVIHESTTTR
jgi:hypothetical protein